MIFFFFKSCHCILKGVDFKSSGRAFPYLCGVGFPGPGRGCWAGLWGLHLGEGWLTSLCGTTLAAVDAATSCFDERYQNLKVGEVELVRNVYTVKRLLPSKVWKGENLVTRKLRLLS